jgi:tyrosinase
MVVSLGPLMSKANNIPKNPRADGLGSNPRCLRRDVNRNAALGATADRAYSLITESKDINGFYNGLLGQPPPKNDPYPWGVSFPLSPPTSLPARGDRLKLTLWKQIHTAGHYVYGVDPGGDPAASPGDPVFYFHHGALDRLWWIWQMQDPENRIDAVPSVKSPQSSTPGLGHNHNHRRAQDPNDAIIDLEWLAPPIKLMEANDQLGGNGGAFCYVYV